MLSRAKIHATIAAQDVARARTFYEAVMGLKPASVASGGIFEAEVGALRQKGVTFESYDMPQFDAATSIASFPGTRSAWFKDTEGNLLGMVQMTDEG